MRGVVQVVVVLLAGVWLAGCGTTTTTVVTGDLNKPPQGEQVVVEETIDATTLAAAMPPPGSQAGLLGSNPQDDLSLGKKYYRTGSYGLAEKHFRRAVETHANDAESWLGLAAAYDRLRRFDLADRAYAQAVKLIGETPEIMNNKGFSYLLRSDYRRARAILLAAQSRAPDSPHIAANLQLLDQAERKAKGIN